MLNGNCLSPFYGQLLDIWYELIDIEPKSPSDIVNENIFNNNQIPIAIDTRVRDHFVAKDITKIKHLLTEDKIILGFNAIKDKYSIDFNYLVYLQVISSIPKKWKKIIGKDDNSVCTEFHYAIFCQMSIEQYSNKQIYNMYINKTYLRARING